MQQFLTLVKVGLDVHAAQTHVAVLDPAGGEVWTRRLQGPPEVALELLSSLGPGATAVYEAGPTGFGLARVAAVRGLDLRVVSPGQLPRNPSDRVKTDRRDAIRLARLLAAGELSFCRVPSPSEEHFRDLVRAREDVRGDLMRARHRLSKFLLRWQIVYPGPGRAWTQAHRRWLGQLRFEDRAATATFVDYLVAVDALVQRRSALERTLSELVPGSPFAREIARFRCFRGIDTLSASGIAAEVGDFARFAHPRLLGDRALGAHLGRAAPSRSDHQGRARPHAQAAGRGRPPLPAPTGKQRRARAAAGRARPTRLPDRLEGAAAPPPALANTPTPTRQANRCRRGRLRTRALNLPLGSSHTRLSRPHTSAEPALPGRQGPEGRATSRAEGRPRKRYGQPATQTPAAPAPRLRAPRRTTVMR
jgi:transposase